MSTGVDAQGRPWSELQVTYWHQGRKETCVFWTSPFARSVGEGTITFDGDTADARLDMYQTRSRRKLGLHWDFDGPDNDRVTLSEASGQGPYVSMAEWNHVRVKPLDLVGAKSDAPLLKPSERLKAFEPLLGQTWHAKAEALQFQTIFEWIPYTDAIYARVVGPNANGESKHLLDAYIFHHTGTNKLRCLALSDGGGVYEGDLTVLADGALQIDLKGYQGDRVVPSVVRFDFEKNGAVHHRAWNISGTERTLTLDVLHKKSEPTK